MNLTTRVPVLIAAGWLVAASAALASFAGTDVFLPSTGRGSGSAGSQWYTTIWVLNPGDGPASVTFTFLYRDQANPSSTVVYTDTVAAGKTAQYENAVETLFGLTRAFGAIRVTSDVPVIVNARIFSQPSGGTGRDTVGQFFAAVPASFAIASGQATSLVGVHQRLPASESEYRYNFGFVETTGASVVIRVTALNTAGKTVGSKDYNLGPFEVRQVSFNAAFPSISSMNTRLWVEVLSGDGRVITFGSGLANRSNDPSTFEMAFDGALLAANGCVRLTLTSSTFTAGGSVPARHTCDAEGLSPALQWSNAPSGTKSFAVILDDPDAPGATWVHWVIYNIPASSTGLAEGVPRTSTLAGGTVQGVDELGRTGYYGPCSPSGSPHRYFFKLYALDRVLTLAPGATKAQLLQAMAGYVLDQAELIGLYQR